MIRKTRLRLWSLMIGVWILSVGLPGQAHAQLVDTLFKDQLIPEDFIEETGAEEFDDDTFLEDLKLQAQQRINLNFATQEDMMELGILTDIQVRNIIYYRERFGQLKTPYELLGIEELSRTDIELLLPFVKFKETADPPKPLKEMFADGKHQIFLRYQQIMEEKEGFTPPVEKSDGTFTSRYLGIEPKLYARYRFQYGTDLSIGITAEQDPGEPFKHPNQAIGIDYLSGHFFMKDRGFLKTLVVGDYEVNLGQGLVMQQSFASRKSSADVIGIKKRKRPLKAHTSANEAEYARGLGAEFKFSEQWSAVLYGSYRKVDGNVLTEQDTLDGPDEAIAFSSLQISGLHRTESELADKNQIGQALAGTSISWSGESARISGNFSYIKLSSPLERAEALYNKFDFRGDQLIQGSMDYQFLRKNISLFGEVAMSDNKGWGMVNGGEFNLPGSVTLALVHRYYAKNYQSLYADAFGEGSRPVNEHGLYIGLEFSPFKYAQLSSYVDIYHHPWLRFGIDAPSSGIDLSTTFTYRPKRNITLIARGRYERKQENAPANETAIDYLVPTIKSNFRVELSYRPTWQVALKTRIEAAWYNDGVNEVSNGFMIFQDLRYSFRKIPLVLYGRYAIYQTDTYDSRIYAYENDLLYVFSVPAYYGRGSRYYLMAKVRVNRYLDFWVRWSQTIWSDRDVVSSGLEESIGNTRSELKVQLRIKF